MAEKPITPRFPDDFSARGLFVAGTDTGVGKTVVTGLLGAWLCGRGVPVRVWKPVQSGVDPRRPQGPGSDPAAYRFFLGPAHAHAVARPLYTYRPAQAPSLAAREEKRRPPHIENISRKCYFFQRKYFTLVEGAGGVLAPLAPGRTVADLMERLRLPVLVVSRPHLGTINHTLLTLRELARRRLRVRGVVVNGVPGGRAARYLPALREMERFSGVPVLGWLPRAPRGRLAGLPQTRAVMESIQKLIYA